MGIIIDKQTGLLKVQIFLIKNKVWNWGSKVEKWEVGNDSHYLEED